MQIPTFKLIKILLHQLGKLLVDYLTINRAVGGYNARLSGPRADNEVPLSLFACRPLRTSHHQIRCNNTMLGNGHNFMNKTHFFIFFLIGCTFFNL